MPYLMSYTLHSKKSNLLELYLLQNENPLAPKNCLPGRIRNANWAAIRHMLRLNSPILRNCAASLLLAAFIDALVLNSEEVIRSQNINFCSLFFS